MSAIRIAFAFFAMLTLSGCGFGLLVPEMNQPLMNAPNEMAFENIIVNNVKCELRKGVWKVMEDLQTTSAHPGNDTSWLLKQGALVTLKLVVDEKASLNPGISYNHPFQNAVDIFPTNGNVNVPRGFTLGAGSSNSADGTRTEIVAFTYSFSDLINEKGVDRIKDKDCAHENGVFIQSNLKIAQFLYNKVFLAKVPGSVVIADLSDPKKAKKITDPFSTFSYQITFVASYGGSVTPTWKFTQISVNPTSPFFSTSRQHTQDLTVAIGETKPATKNKPAAPSGEQIMLLQTALFGQAVASAIQSQTHP